MLEEAGFEIRRLTGWTTLLFPAAWAARTLRLSAKGRDYDAGQAPSGLANGLMNLVMLAEFQFLKLCPMPFGVALFCVARRIEPENRAD